MSDTISATHLAASDDGFSESYRRLLPEIERLRVDEVTRINLEITSAVVTVLGCVPKIRALMPRLKALAEFDLSTVEKLEAYAMALSYAQAQFLVAAAPQDDLQALVREGALLRDRLVADARALVRRGIVEGNRLDELSGKSGFKNLAVDLQMLAALFRDRWTELDGKWGIQQAELVRAKQVALGVLCAVGSREQRARKRGTVPANIRARAFTLFMRAYSEARRGVQYLRWHDGDFDEIAPSLFAGRSNGRIRPETAEAEAADQALPNFSGGAVDSNKASSVTEVPSNGVA